MPGEGVRGPRPLPLVHFLLPGIGSISQKRFPGDLHYCALLQGRPVCRQQVFTIGDPLCWFPELLHQIAPHWELTQHAHCLSAPHPANLSPRHQQCGTSCPKPPGILSGSWLVHHHSSLCLVLPVAFPPGFAPGSKFPLVLRSRSCWDGLPT